MSGFGYGWGSLPWGGFLALGGVPPSPPDPPDGFDIFCFFNEPDSMGSILVTPGVVVYDSGGQISIVPGDEDLRMASGAPASDGNAFVAISSGVPATWTLQVVALFPSLPSDFTNLTFSHIYFGASDVSALAGGLFVSQAGIAYAGAVSLDGNNDLVLGGPFQVIPGTAGVIQPGVSYTFRIAVDDVTSTAYVFATPTAAVPFFGHTLIAILPSIPSNGFVSDRTTISVRGTDTHPSVAQFDQICLGNGLLMPNLPPRADAGRDQSLRLCSVGILDGSASVDPEGGTLTYNWRLIDAPVGSSFAFEGADGFTLPAGPPTGFTDKFYSAELGDEALIDLIVTGDVLTVGGISYTIATTGVDGSGYFVQITDDLLPDNLLNATFKLLRRRALTNPTTVKPSFLPDEPGIYKFDLVVYDGQYLSDPSIVIVNVLESQIPKGCIPDLGFLWQYLGDFWKLVEDRERIQVLWEGMAQVAAAELLTLWQVDYSKSLRDIQRTFQRRWLHYDLKLPEPLPGLTLLRRMYGGVTSASIAPGGVGGVQGTLLEITSPAHATIQIPFLLSNPYTGEKLADVIRVKLQGLDARYVVTVIADSTSNTRVRITAPFLFEIGGGTTISLFTNGTKNQQASGTAGLRLGARTYRVDFSLSGLDIKENDLLVIGGDGYRISRLIDDPTDQHRFQRVVVQTDLPITTSASWAIPSHVTSRLLNFYDGLLSARDSVTFEVINSEDNSSALLSATVVGACAQEKTKLGVDVSAIDQYLSRPTFSAELVFAHRRTYIPIGDLVVDIPHLQEFIKETDDGAVLRRNVDFFIEEYRGRNSLRFVAGNPGESADVWQGGAPPDRMWAEVTYLDNRPTIEANFGIPAEFTLDQLAEIDTDLDYLSAVRGLWYSYLNGPTMFNLRVGSQILLGLPFAEEAGVIEEIRTDFSPTQGRILVRDASNSAVVRSYSYPSALGLEINPATGVAYVVGDSVKQFAPLVQGVEIVDYVKDPRWFQGILNQGVFFEVEKFHKFMVRVDSAAFSLSSLLFVRSFVLRVKPTYTFPLIIVRSRVGDTEVSVSDEVTADVTLILNEGACFADGLGYSTMLDDYRAAGGGVRNQLDSDGDLNTPAPVFPTPDTEVPWGLDKKYLCPEDEISFAWCIDHAGGAVALDLGFSLDSNGNTPAHDFSATSLVSVPAPPTGYTFPGSSVVAVTGIVDTVRLVVAGDLGSDPGDYELVIVVNGADSGTVPVTVGPAGLVSVLSTSVAVIAGDTVTLRLRPASGGARTPNWVTVLVTLYQEGVTFELDTGLPAGTYCFVKTG